MSSLSWSFGLSGSVIVGALGISSAGAQSTDNHLYDRFQFGAAGTALVLGTNVRVDGSLGREGTEIDVEKDLGQKRTIHQPRLDFRWRPGRRHEVEIGYQFARRTAVRILDKDVEFGDTTFHADATVESSTREDQIFLTYRFAFIAHDRTQIGVGIGAEVMLFTMTMDALASTEGQSGAYSQSADLPGPSGSVGVYARQRLGERWYLEGDARGIKLSLNGYGTTTAEIGAGVRFYLSPSVGIEGGYGLSRIRVDGAGERGESAGNGTATYWQQHIRVGAVVRL